MIRVLLLGATSGIATAVARAYAAEGAQLYLVARSRGAVQALSKEIELRGTPVRTHVTDLDDVDAHAELLDGAWQAFGGFDRVLIAYGTLPDETRAAHDPAYAGDVLHTNLVSQVALLDRIIERAGRPSSMTIGVLGSVAGERGRNRVAIYSAAKAGLARYVEALQQRTWPDGPRITLFKPGWVRTRMTQHMPPSPAIASPDHAARRIVAALAKGKREVYIPGWWRMVMWGVRHVPDFLYSRMKF